MTDKDKELLIVDLCGRLPYYGVYRTTIHVDLAEEGRDMTVEDTYQDGKLINSKIL